MRSAHSPRPCPLERFGGPAGQSRNYWFWGGGGAGPKPLGSFRCCFGLAGPEPPAGRGEGRGAGLSAGVLRFALGRSRGGRASPLSSKPLLPLVLVSGYRSEHSPRLLESCQSGQAGIEQSKMVVTDQAELEGLVGPRVVTVWRGCLFLTHAENTQFHVSYMLYLKGPNEIFSPMRFNISKQAF